MLAGRTVPLSVELSFQKHVALLRSEAVDSSAFDRESELIFAGLVLAEVVESSDQACVHPCESVHPLARRHPIHRRFLVYRDDFRSEAKTYRASS